MEVVALPPSPPLPAKRLPPEPPHAVPDALALPVPPYTTASVEAFPPLPAGPGPMTRGELALPPPTPPWAVLDAVALPPAITVVDAVALPPARNKPPAPPVAELWPCTLPIPVSTVVAVPVPPGAPSLCSNPPTPPVATVEPRRELALISKTLNMELALPPLPAIPDATEFPLPA